MHAMIKQDAALLSKTRVEKGKFLKIIQKHFADAQTNLTEFATSTKNQFNVFLALIKIRIFLFIYSISNSINTFYEWIENIYSIIDRNQFSLSQSIM